ncbi:hypothetical protein SISSUDRAFT_166710 [Sistotremastrum suecicum HHB10207 ss-3]|uniref:Fanconi-associated nuclease n=1 Tax=Sistotremastrum suecicum HHB10207 ss-3 TaxID=1314776 RepID=A0A166AMS7_9AGAM|nr:hypothetical protein SISSUDRAFT_166710 [Sistotremastrum suecicum HHB10207 ss-3]
MAATISPKQVAEVFWGIEGGNEEELEDDKAMDGGTRESMYVTTFEEMLNTVLEHESFLFSSEELDIFSRYKTMSYHARYLLIRLCLRKTAWFTHQDLSKRYQGELGCHVQEAMDELCRNDPTAPAREEDLCSEGESSKGPRKQALGNAWSFARSTDDASADELLNCLNLDQLKTLAKQNKILKNGMTSEKIKEALKSNGSSQATLSFVRAPSKTKTNSTFFGINYTSDGKKATQAHRLKQQVLMLTSKCIRINDIIYQLFMRLNLIYFRSTSYGISFLLPAILNASRKRQYPTYEATRTTAIFPSREALLAYEEALTLEGQVESILGENWTAGQANRNKTPEAGGSTRIQDAKTVRLIWEEQWERWLSLVDARGQEDKRPKGLERFDCGYVLTRVIYKGVQALGILKEYDTEIKVLEALLKQTRWRRGRRGAWYDRLALIYMTHLDKTRENYEKARQIVLAGLEDPMTHIVYRPGLERRLSRLENKLQIDPEKRHKCMGWLKKPDVKVIAGVRVWNNKRKAGPRRSSLTPLNADRPSRSSSESGLDEAKFDLKGKGRESLNENGREDVEKWVGKSIWAGRNDEEVNVETLALQYYENLGFKGFHSEGSIVSCIFSLLFWDVLFTPIPGAFETAYQTAPLDIDEDSFYYARQEKIESLLTELRAGRAAEILDAVDQRERPRGTWCIGVRWDMFERNDLIEIVEVNHLFRAYGTKILTRKQCLGGEALAVICKLLCEDHGHRSSGVPDLFIWRADKKECKFVEVKGPGDTLQENQKASAPFIPELRSSFLGAVVDRCSFGSECFRRSVQGRREGPCRNDSASKVFRD